MITPIVGLPQPSEFEISVNPDGCIKTKQDIDVAIETINKSISNKGFKVYSVISIWELGNKIF